MSATPHKLAKLEQAVRQTYEAKDPQRAAWADWLYDTHVFTVADYAQSLAERYDVPVYMCRAAAVLHDIADASMSRFDPNHEQASMDIARQLLDAAGYDAAEIGIIVDDALKLHSCHDGQRPDTQVGKVLATADALAHLQTDFYTYATETMMDDMPIDKRRAWAAKKIRRDFNDKIAYDAIREEARPYYEKLAAHFNNEDRV
ncbi:MAG TPA: HD domain-containing protein [Candidatus Saccharimonadales bacterium]|nr:HD domain-containing protein [Candidatus Saccharimonadales bacterium]